MTVRNIPDELKQKLRERAAKNGKSMEAEVREILTNSIIPSEEKELVEKPPQKTDSKEALSDRLDVLLKDYREEFYKRWDSTDDYMKFIRGGDYGMPD